MWEKIVKRVEPTNESKFWLFGGKKSKIDMPIANPIKKRRKTQTYKIR